MKNLNGNAKAAAGGVSAGIVVEAIKELVFDIWLAAPGDEISYTDWARDQHTLIVLAITLVVATLLRFLDRDGSGGITADDFRPQRKFRAEAPIDDEGGAA